MGVALPVRPDADNLTEPVSSPRRVRKQSARLPSGVRASVLQLLRETLSNRPIAKVALGPLLIAIGAAIWSGPDNVAGWAKNIGGAVFAARQVFYTPNVVRVSKPEFVGKDCAAAPTDIAFYLHNRGDTTVGISEFSVNERNIYGLRPRAIDMIIVNNTAIMSLDNFAPDQKADIVLRDNDGFFTEPTEPGCALQVSYTVKNTPGGKTQPGTLFQCDC